MRYFEDNSFGVGPTAGSQRLGMAASMAPAAF